jgi:hypothetical protein
MELVRPVFLNCKGCLFFNRLRFSNGLLPPPQTSNSLVAHPMPFAFSDLKAPSTIHTITLEIHCSHWPSSVVSHYFTPCTQFGPDGYASTIAGKNKFALTKC